MLIRSSVLPVAKGSKRQPPQNSGNELFRGNGNRNFRGALGAYQRFDVRVDRRGSKRAANTHSDIQLGNLDV